MAPVTASEQTLTTATATKSKVISRFSVIATGWAKHPEYYIAKAYIEVNEQGNCCIGSYLEIYNLVPTYISKPEYFKTKFTSISRSSLV